MTCLIWYLPIPTSIPIFGCESKTFTVLPTRISLILLERIVPCPNPNLWTLSKALKVYWILRSTTSPCLLHLGNSQMFPPLGTLSGHKPPHTEETENWTTLYLEVIGPRIWEPMLCVVVTRNYLVSAKDITVQELIHRKDTHQQEQQQQILCRWPWLLLNLQPRPPCKLTYTSGTGRYAWFVAMSGSEQHHRVALVSADEQAIIGGIVNRNLLEIDLW